MPTAVLGTYNHDYRYVGLVRLMFNDGFAAKTEKAKQLADKLARHAATLDPETTAPFERTIVEPGDRTVAALIGDLKVELKDSGIWIDLTLTVTGDAEMTTTWEPA